MIINDNKFNGSQAIKLCTNIKVTICSFLKVLNFHIFVRDYINNLPFSCRLEKLRVVSSISGN